MVEGRLILKDRERSPVPCVVAHAVEEVCVVLEEALEERYLRRDIMASHEVPEVGVLLFFHHVPGQNDRGPSRREVGSAVLFDAFQEREKGVKISCLRTSWSDRATSSATGGVDVIRSVNGIFQLSDKGSKGPYGVRETTGQPRPSRR